MQSGLLREHISLFQPPCHTLAELLFHCVGRLRYSPWFIQENHRVFRRKIVQEADGIVIEVMKIIFRSGKIIKFLHLLAEFLHMTGQPGRFLCLKLLS